MRPAVTAIPIWTSIATHAPCYQVWLCDIWGVLHNGVSAYRSAVDACAMFRRQGGTVVLVSNAPRPSANVASQLAGFGITANSYDAILTSGDVTRSLLHDMPPRAVYLLGPERHSVLTDGLPHRFVDPAAADLVLCSGLIERSADETPADYQDHLQSLASRGLPMLCANPDLTAESGTTMVYCAGALAALYAQSGGVVTYAGKPHAAIYAAAHRLVAELRGQDVPRDRVLAIGDGINTDIRGAQAAGIDALYIASRVHLTAPFSDRSVAQLFAANDAQPKAAMAELAW
jgi:HAD superfamily hydrolase (TIGR01459 family)